MQSCLSGAVNPHCKEGLISMICVPATSSFLARDPISIARLGGGDSASQSRYKCSTELNLRLHSYNAGSRNIFPRPSFLCIPQTKHCYIMIPNIYFKIIMITLKQQQLTLGRRFSRPYRHLRTTMDITLLLRRRGRGGDRIKALTYACFYGNLFFSPK